MAPKLRRSSPQDLWLNLLLHSVQLGNFSFAWNLAILQVGPRSGMILHWGPASHPPAPALVENPTFMQYRRLEFGGCLKGVWRMSKRCLEGVWLVSARYREHVWRVQRRCLRSFKIYLDPKYFWGLKFFGHKHYWIQIFHPRFPWPNIFWTQNFFDPNILDPIFSWTLQFSDTKSFL